MKKILLILPVLTNAALQAQTTQGSWMMGGNAHIRYEAESGPNRWSTDLNPTVGYFVSNNIALGLGVPLAFSSEKSTASSGIVGFVDGQQVEISKMARSEIGIAPFIRGYIGSGKFRPFVQAQAGVVKQYYKTVYRTIPQRRNAGTGAAISGGGGLTYFISEHVGVEALVNAVYSDNIRRRFPPTSIGLYFGLQFYLPKK